jgi:hypothetical protein
MRCRPHDIGRLYYTKNWGLIGLPDANAITGTFIDNRKFQLSLKLTLSVKAGNTILSEIRSFSSKNRQV